MDKAYKAHQLRLDKVIYACEAAAINLACILVFILGDRYFVGVSRDLLMLVPVVFGVSYTLFMGIGNGIRLWKINRLEKDI
jgi:hypothetical protein